MMLAKCWPVSLERKGEADGGYERKKKKAISAQNMQPTQSA